MCLSAITFSALWHALADWWQSEPMKWVFVLGFLAQAFFSARLFLQWLLSERSRQVVSPSIYWILSIAGSYLLFIYGWLRDDFAIIFGQFISYYIYLWNLREKGILARIPVVFRYVLLLTPVAAVLLAVGQAEAFVRDFFMNEKIPFWLVLFGSSGQIVFTLRFIYQWFYSYKRKASILPAGFWIISLVGSGLIVSYGIFRRDPVIILGQSFGFVAYIRNIMLGVKAGKRTVSEVGATAEAGGDETASEVKAVQQEKRGDAAEAGDVAVGGKKSIVRMRFKAWIKDYGRYLLWFAALLPLAFLRDFTPSNELRYMSIADEALREGHWFAFYHQGEPYADKPPLYLWIVMLGRWLFGDGCMGFVSLFSILPALGIVAVMDRWIRTSDGLAGGLDAKRRAAGQWMLLTTAFFAGSMVVLRMDMLMSLFIVLALRVFFRMYAGGEKSGDRWLFPFLVFMALFTKGPYGVMIPVAGAMVFLLVRRRRDLFGHCFGWRFWLLLVGLSGIWWGLVYAEGGYDYLHNLLFNQTVHRAVDSFSHKRGFFYYFWSFGHAAAPWSPLYVAVLLTALFTGLRQWNSRKRVCAAGYDAAVEEACRRPVSAGGDVVPVGARLDMRPGTSDDLAAFFITVFLTSLLMLSCVSAKLEVYLLPVYPFLVYYVLSRMPLWENRVWARVLVSVPLAALTAALPAVLLLSRWMPETAALLRGFPIYIAAVVLTAGGLWGWRLLWGRRDTAATVRLTGLSLFVAIFFGAFQLPELNPYLGYGSLARAGQALAAEQQAAAMSGATVPAGMVVPAEATGTGTDEMSVQSRVCAADTAVVYGAYRVRRAVGMAAYVKRPVRELAGWDEVQAIWQAGRPLLMFISGKALAEEPAVAAAVAGRPQWEAGAYRAVWFDAVPQVEGAVVATGQVEEGGRP